MRARRSARRTCPWRARNGGRRPCGGRTAARRWAGRWREAVNWMTELLGRPPVAWRDLLDIAVVSVLIYEVLKLIRGTRAAQMAVGAGLIVTLLLLSQAAHLETMNWLIRNMFG